MILGLLIAIWALSSPAVANNVIATVCWLWLLAIVAVVDGVLSGQGLGSAQLGVWQITSDSERFWFRDYFYWPGAALSLGSALVIGALAARSTARLAERRVGAVVSGVAGPLLVAAAYFLAAPRLAGIRAEQVSAHLAAPYAVIAGLAGSALVAAMAQRASAGRPQPADSTGSRLTEPGRVPAQRAAGADDLVGAPDDAYVPSRSYGTDRPPNGSPRPAVRDRTAAPVTTPLAGGQAGQPDPSGGTARMSARAAGLEQPDDAQPDDAAKPKGKPARFGRRTR